MFTTTERVQNINTQLETMRERFDVVTDLQQLIVATEGVYYIAMSVSYICKEVIDSEGTDDDNDPQSISNIASYLGDGTLSATDVFGKAIQKLLKMEKPEDPLHLLSDLEGGGEHILQRLLGEDESTAHQLFELIQIFNRVYRQGARIVDAPD